MNSWIEMTNEENGQPVIIAIEKNEDGTALFLSDDEPFQYEQRRDLSEKTLNKLEYRLAHGGRVKDGDLIFDFGDEVKLEMPVDETGAKYFLTCSKDAFAQLFAGPPDEDRVIIEELESVSAQIPKTLEVQDS